MTSSAPPVAVTARRAQTRERLMAAASSVFAERGIIGASVEEICETAGFTRGAFYSNFASKDELVLALLRHEIETQYAAAQQAIEAVKVHAGAGHDPAETLTAALSVFEDATGRVDREWIMTQQELLLYAARQPAVQEPYLQFSEGYMAQFGALISEGLQAAGLEFTLPFEDAVSLLTACHQQDHVQALLNRRVPDSHRLSLLVRAITRPATGGRASG